MGSTESSTRKVSFALDEEDNVRVLRGVKLSEDVLQRMRGTDLRPPPGEPGPKPVTPDPPRPFEPPRPSEPPRPTEPTRPTAAEIQEELRRRYEREQAIMREELARISQRERAAAREELSSALRRERVITLTEAEKAKNLGKQLERKEAELKKQEAFFREKLAQLEQKNLAFYKQARERFGEAADRTAMRVRPRSMEPVCPALQSQILQCYRDNRDQTLRCSDLAREYMQCIHAAKKNLLVNHG